MVLELFNESDSLLQGALAELLPEGFLADFVVANAFLIMTVLSVVAVIVFLLVAFFFDFVTDAWKLPIAAAVDGLKYLALFWPWLGVVSAVLGVVVFIWLSDAKFMKYPFAAISAAMGVLMLPLFWGDYARGVILAIVPLNTMMMFVSTLID